jgi:hypothetical protein
MLTRPKTMIGVKDSLSTKAAADALAAETRAFGNKAAQLELQMATDAFLRAKEALRNKVSTSETVTHKDK